MLPVTGQNTQNSSRDDKQIFLLNHGNSRTMAAGRFQQQQMSYQKISNNKAMELKSLSKSSLIIKDTTNNTYHDRVQNLLQKIDGEKNKLNKWSGSNSMKLTNGSSQSYSSLGWKNKTHMISFQEEIDASKQSIDQRSKKEKKAKFSASELQLKRIATGGEASYSKQNNHQYINTISDYSITKRHGGSFIAGEEKIPQSEERNIHFSIGETEQSMLDEKFSKNNAENFKNYDEDMNIRQGGDDVRMRLQGRGFRNTFTSSDSRFEVINTLKAKNVQQERIIEELKAEIILVDEFKLVLDAFMSKEKQEEDITSKQHVDKRIMLLKSQLKKQQRYIAQLTSLLTSARKSFTEVLDVCRLLVDGVNKSAKSHQVLQKVLTQEPTIQKPQPQQSLTQLTQNHIEPIETQTSHSRIFHHKSNNKEKLKNDIVQPENQNTQEDQKKIANIKPTEKKANNIVQNQDDQIVNEDDEHSAKKSEKDIVSLLTQMTHQQAIKKLFEYLIEVDDRHRFVNNFNEAYSKVQQFEYNNEEFKKLFSLQKHRVTQKFVIKFAHPLRTLFEKFPQCFPVPTLYEILDPQQKQTIQYRAFGLMAVLKKTNRHFKRIRAFSLFHNNPLFFKDQEYSNMNITIPSLLLENQKSFDEFMQPRGYSRILSLNFHKIMQTDSSLGLLLDKLLVLLSTFVTKGESQNELVELIHLLRKGCEDLICLGIVTPGDQGNQTSQKITQLVDKQSANNSEIVQNAEWINYDRSMDMHAEFNEKRMTLNALFEELSQATMNKEVKESQIAISKINNVLESLTTVFESKENQVRLKTIEIEYLRNLSQLIHQEEGFVSEFIDQMQYQIKELLTPINQKISQVVIAFNGLFDGQKTLDLATKQNYSNIFKRNTKEMLELIKRILTSSCPSNQINILTLKQQFNQRIQTVLSRQAIIKPQKRKTSFCDQKLNLPANL